MDNNSRGFPSCSLIYWPFSREFCTYRRRQLLPTRWWIPETDPSRANPLVACKREGWEGGREGRRERGKEGQNHNMWYNVAYLYVTLIPKPIQPLISRVIILVRYTAFMVTVFLKVTLIMIHQKKLTSVTLGIIPCTGTFPWNAIRVLIGIIEATREVTVQQLGLYSDMCTGMSSSMRFPTAFLLVHWLKFLSEGVLDSFLEILLVWHETDCPWNVLFNANHLLIVFILLLGKQIGWISLQMV